MQLARSKATSSLDHASNELSERVGNGIHPNTSSISENSSHASPSSEARSDLENNGTLASSKETSGYVVNGPSTEVKPIKSKTSRFSASILAHYLLMYLLSLSHSMNQRQMARLIGIDVGD